MFDDVLALSWSLSFATETRLPGKPSFKLSRGKTLSDSELKLHYRCAKMLSHPSTVRVYGNHRMKGFIQRVLLYLATGSTQELAQQLLFAKIQMEIMRSQLPVRSRSRPKNAIGSSSLASRSVPKSNN